MTGNSVRVPKEYGNSSHRILLEHERNYGMGMDALVPFFLLETRTVFWFAHGCSGHRDLTVFSWNTNEIMVGGTRTELWFGQRYSSQIIVWVGML